MSNVLNNVMYGQTKTASWNVYFEYYGSNEKNQSGWSDKFWEVSHTAGSSNVTVRWGKTGTYGQTMVVSIDQAFDKVREKTRKGYREVTSRSSYKLPEAPKAAPAPAVVAAVAAPAANQLGADTVLNKLKSAGFPYNMATKVEITATEVKCFDKDGDLIVTLTNKGALALVG